MQIESLSYAVRYWVVLTYLGELCLALAALTAVPFVVTLALREWHAAPRYAATLALLVALGGFAGLPKPTRVQRNEGTVLVALTFLLAPLATTYPLMAVGLRLEDALFEAISGVTTRGLSAVADPAATSPGFLFARAWLQ